MCPPPTTASSRPRRYHTQYCPQHEQLRSHSAGGEQGPSSLVAPLSNVGKGATGLPPSPARESTPETKLASAEGRGHAISQAGSADSLSTPLLSLTATTQPAEDKRHCDNNCTCRSQGPERPAVATKREPRKQVLVFLVLSPDEEI